jgi:hypothetical protein
MVDSYCPPSASSYPPRLDAVSIACHAVAAAALVQTPQANPDRFTYTMQRVRSKRFVRLVIDSARRRLQQIRMHETTTGRGNCKSLGFCCEPLQTLRYHGYVNTRVSAEPLWTRRISEHPKSEADEAI